MVIYSQDHLVIYSGVIAPFGIAFCVFPGIPLDRRTSGSRALCILNPDKYSQRASKEAVVILIYTPIGEPSFSLHISLYLSPL